MKVSARRAASMISQRTGFSFGVKQVEQQIRDGLLKGEKLGHTYVVDEQDLAKYIVAILRS